jgi:nucleoside-diphosphate-sugar epimerase
MQISITGATGFIGRRLVRYYERKGATIHLLSRKKIPVAGTGTKLFQHDLITCTTSDLIDFVDGSDVVYHCAAELLDVSKMSKVNVEGTKKLLIAAVGRVGRWVQLSSTGVYGQRLNGNISEDIPPSPDNTYERSKAAADELVYDAVEKRNLQCVVLRPSNVYGIDMPNQSLFQLIKMIDRGIFFFIGKRGAVANYIHVENVVDALVLCGTSTLPSNGRAYNVSDHRKLEEFVSIIAAALGKKMPQLRLPESLVRTAVAIVGNIPRFPLSLSRVTALTNRTVYRTDRIEFELGYKNTISMEEGIDNLARYYKNNQTT